jgi:hypothetical protein
MPRNTLIIILSVQLLALSMVVSYWYYDSIQRNMAYHECLVVTERIARQDTRETIKSLPTCYYR